MIKEPALPVILFMLLAPVAAAAEPSLVPDVPSTAPDYFCTWNVQGFACSYTNASDQADMMTEANLFGSKPGQNWVGFFPQARGDLIFLLDDAFDFPIGGGHHHPARGSVELEAARFPSYKGTPAQRLAALSRDARASRLLQMLDKGHHDVKLSPVEWRRLIVWMDCNSVFYGAYRECDKQARGELVLPRLGLPADWRERVFAVEAK